MSAKSIINLNSDVWAEPGGAIQKEKIFLDAHLSHMLQQPPASLEAWERKRAEIKERVFLNAGIFPDDSHLDIELHGKIKMDGYTIHKLSFQSRKNLRVTANLFVPDGEGPFPAILNVHGHTFKGKITDFVAARGHAFALEGFVVLSIDAIGAGERCTVHGEFEHHMYAGVPLLAIGESLLGAQVLDNMRGIDLLQSLDYVDSSRIGVTGASGGGNQTMWISALDSRVKASVPVVSVGTFEGYVGRGNCWCETLFDGLNISEEWGILGMIAPNPLLIVTANKEKIEAFLPHEMLRSYKDAKKIYSLYGAEENLSYQIIDLPHGYFPEMLQSAIGWFKCWLQNEGNALPRKIPEYKTLEEEYLLCFPPGTRPDKVKSLIGYVSQRSAEIKHESMLDKTFSPEEKKRQLSEILRITDWPDQCEPRNIIEYEDEGCDVKRFTVESEYGVLVPCILVMPEKATSSIVIVSSPDGKKELLENEFVAQIISSGKALCLADLRNTGENRWAHVDDTLDIFSARALLWLGHTSIGDWCRDLYAVKTALKKINPDSDFELMGFDETAMAAVALAALKDEFSKVSVVNLLSSYAQSGIPPVQRHTVWIPGILHWGDVTLMAALAKCKLEIKSLVSSAGKYLDETEFEKWRDEVIDLAQLPAENTIARISTLMRMQS